MKRFSILLLLLLLCITSCNARGSYETDSFDTTAPEVTTDEITTGASETWYLTKQMEVDPKIPEISEEHASLIVKPPLVTEGEQNGILYKVEFFRDDYKMGELIQVRITLTNLNPVVGVKPSYPGGVAVAYFDSHSGTQSSREVALPMNEEERNMISQGALAYMVVAEIFSRENYERRFPLTDIKYGETHVIERVFLADPDFFGEPRDFTFTVTLEPFSKGVAFFVTTPIEVVSQDT